MEAARDEWFAADGWEAAVDKMNAAAVDFSLCAPAGFFLSYQACRKNISGVVNAPAPFFWGVSKS